MIAKGSSLRIEYFEGSWKTLRATTSDGLNINNEMVDCTNKDGDNWQASLVNCGTQGMTLTAKGYVNDTESLVFLTQQIIQATEKRYRISSENGEVFECAFLMSAYNRNGDYNSAETFDVTLNSKDTVIRTVKDVDYILTETGVWIQTEIGEGLQIEQ